MLAKEVLARLLSVGMVLVGLGVVGGVSLFNLKYLDSFSRKTSISRASSL